MVPNRTLAGRYRLTDALGRAELADVFIATDLVLQREVVVKVLPASDDAEASNRFVAGARALSRLEHPAIVRVFDADVDADEPYLVMEQVQGRPLCDLLAEGRLEPHRAAHLGAQVAAALVHAHSQGVVHRDVKPSNVLVDASDTARLADFGIVGLPDQPRVTVTGQLLGSAAYIAPEQVRGDQVGPAADVYALGLLLLEAVTGRAPFPGTPIESALARLEREVVVPEDVPDAWRTPLRAMTRRDPAARPSAAAVHGWLLAPESVALHVGRDTAAEGAAQASRVRRHSATRRAPRRRQQLPRWHRSATSITSLATAAALVAVALTGSNLEAIVRPLRDVIAPPAAASGTPEPGGDDANPVAFGPVAEDARDAVAGLRSSQASSAGVAESGVPRADRLPRAPDARQPRAAGGEVGATTRTRAPDRGAPDRATPRGDDDSGTSSGTPPGTGSAPPGLDAPPGQGGAPNPGDPDAGGPADPGGGPPGDGDQRQPERDAPDRGAPDRDPPDRAEPPRAEPPSAPPASAPPPRQEPSREPPDHVPSQVSGKAQHAAPERQEPSRDAAATAQAASPAAAAKGSPPAGAPTGG